MNRVDIFGEKSRRRTVLSVSSALLCLASLSNSGCHKEAPPGAATSNQALLQQQIADTEHDSTMSPEAKANYIQFLKDKLGGPAPAPTKAP